MITQADIQGHWRRDWLRAPGFEDPTTRVHWLQAGEVYADLRLPLERPELGQARALAELPEAALEALAKAEGFAGTTEVTDSICTWTRAINWHGATDEVDAGKLWFDDQGGLIEDGVHAEYRELWQRVAEGPALGQQLSGLGLTAFLVTVGDAFVLGIGLPDAPAAAKHDVLFERVHALGHWVGETGMADLSTNPFQEGMPVLKRRQDGILWHRRRFDGSADWVPLT